jgi:hypothetical protein
MSQLIWPLADAEDENDYQIFIYLTEKYGKNASTLFSNSTILTLLT